MIRGHTVELLHKIAYVKSRTEFKSSLEFLEGALKYNVDVCHPRAHSCWLGVKVLMALSFDRPSLTWRACMLFLALPISLQPWRN